MPTSSERLLAAYEAWNRRDLDGWLAFMHPEVRLENSGLFLGVERVYLGHDGMTDFWERLHEPWDSFAIDAECIDEGDDVLIATIRFRAKGVESGIDVDMSFAHAIRLRDGLAGEIIARPTAEEARAALAR